MPAPPGKCLSSSIYLQQYAGFPFLIKRCRALPAHHKSMTVMCCLMALDCTVPPATDAGLWMLLVAFSQLEWRERALNIVVFTWWQHFLHSWSWADPQIAATLAATRFIRMKQKTLSLSNECDLKIIKTCVAAPQSWQISLFHAHSIDFYLTSSPTFAF